ncbi:hypothetical protein OAO55_01510 [Bacteroidales bacterium]|nr:hypothetical protein [Bacteroidales bacterium]
MYGKAGEYAEDTVLDISKEEYEDYIDEMRIGNTFDISASVFGIHGFGFSAKYGQYTTQNKMGIIEDDISITFIGGGVVYNPSILNGEGHLLLGIAIDMESNSFGSNFTVGFDIFLNDYIAIGFQSGLAFGKFDEYSTVGEYDYKPEVLHRIEGSVGLKIYL